ncbi:MAG: 2-phosphosulfolactate phosphatase [Isosphaeraceae bacterium]|nr:2-phosphosulfolactate phosphatase [Isosphaeraceae bacterium]
MPVKADKPPLSVHLLPSLIPPGALRGGVAVVIDVLRASTLMIQALDAGCEAILPCLEIEEAQRLAADLPPGRALLAGERQGLPIPGFDLGNSPGQCTPEVCRGKTLVMTTTNGTRAVLACREAARVLIAGFVNLAATARALRADGRPVHLVCAGTDGRISLEDHLGAGALAVALGHTYEPSGNDEAMIAVTSWHGVSSQAHDGAEGGTLFDYLTRGRGGRRVRELGLVQDIEDAARVNRFDLVAELKRDPLRIVPTGFHKM